jgi:hypothetical protein
VKLQVQVNGAHVSDRPPIQTPSGGTILVTPPLTSEFWLARVPVAKQQAVVCFPKFGTIGIGFQHEDDWNTNLPYTVPAEEIYDHIKHNKACRASKETCIAAIRLLSDYAAQLKAKRV